MILRLFFVDNFYEKRLTFINFGTKFEQNLKQHRYKLYQNSIDMNFDRLKEKLEILADAAKYDVSCSSSGGTRKKKRVP